jgi:hypothetical protein
MRLPAALLAKLTLTGLAFGAACESADDPEHCKPEPIIDQRPAFAPKVTPEKQPAKLPAQPTVQTKPKPRKVWASICGQTQLVDENATNVRCGRG